MQRPSTVVLRVIDKKSKLGTVESFDRNRAQEEDGIVVTVHPSRSLRVLVKDLSGSPLEGAEVFLMPGRNTPIGLRGGPSERTDADGEIIYPYIYPGDTHSVSARLEGYVARQGRANVPDPESEDWKDTVELVLEEAQRTQTGRVLDAKGMLAVGVSVGTALGSKTETDAHGEFTLTDLPDSEVYVYASAGDYYGAAKAGKDTGDIVIELQE